MYILKNQVRYHRRLKDITQEELADKVGCTRQTIIALEKNKYNPSLVHALSIAKVLNTPVETIFELTEAQNDQ